MQYDTLTAYIDETISLPPIPLDNDTAPVRDADDSGDDDSDGDQE